jgi:uncharacterized membrane protein YccC
MSSKPTENLTPLFQKQRGQVMSTLLIVILVLLLLGGGGFGYSRYGNNGLGGALGLVLVFC